MIKLDEHLLNMACKDETTRLAVLGLAHDTLLQDMRVGGGNLVLKVSY